MTIREHVERHPIACLLAAVAIGGLMAFVAFRVSVSLRDGYQLAAEESFVPSKYDEHLLELDRQAVDNSYRDKVEQLISVWFKDDTDQPKRALNGVAIARKRYIDMQMAIDKRESDLAKIRGIQH